MQADELTVQVLKHDGREYRRWRARIAERKEKLIVLDAEFDTDVHHHLLGEIKRGTRTVEYYWLDRWYNVFRFADPCGALRNYYCNINVPPTFDGQLLSYVDLDTDILVEADFSYRVLDLEEFEQNAAHYGYSRELRLNAERALDELITLIESRAFPFNE